MPHFSICSSEYSFASFEGTDDAGCLELVHDTAGPVVADRKPPLDGRGGTLLGADYEPGCFFEQRIA